MLHRQEHDEKLAHKKDRQVALRTMGNLSCQLIKIQVIHKITRVRFMTTCQFCTILSINSTTARNSETQMLNIVTEACIWMTANIQKQYQKHD
jgi:hypothetical protein